MEHNEVLMIDDGDPLQQACTTPMQIVIVSTVI